MRSSPSTANLISFASRASLSASAASTRSSSSSSAIRIVIERFGLGMDFRRVFGGGVLECRLGEHGPWLAWHVIGVLDRQLHVERRAVPRAAMGFDRAVVAFDDLAAEREPDAGAWVGAAAMQTLECA